MDVSNGKRYRVRMAMAVALGLAFHGGLLVAAYAAGGVLFTLPLLAIFIVQQFFVVPRVMLDDQNADIISPQDRPQLYTRLTRLSQQANVSPPDIAIISRQTPNAFLIDPLARTPVICVTEGALTGLDSAALDAVLAHEIAHHKNRDATLLPVIAASLIIGDLFMRAGDPQSASSSERRPAEPSRNTPLWVIGLMTLGVPLYVAGLIIYRIASQQREYAADRGAVMITGEPYALIETIERIDGSLAEADDNDLRDTALQQFIQFVPETRDKDRSLGILTPHPSAEQRVERIKTIATEIEAGPSPPPA